MASADDQDLGRHWLIRYVIPSLVLALSALWFFQERSYESAIALVTSAAVLGGVLLSQGRIAVAFIGGFLLGGALATFVAYKTFSVVPSEPILASEFSAKEPEISDLRTQNEKLKSELNVALNRNKELLQQLPRNLIETPEHQELAAPESEPPDNAVQQAVPQPTNRQSVNEMLFELSGCEADGTTVWCNFTIENRTPTDRRVHLEVMELSARGTNSRVFDNLGNEYHATGGSLAGSTMLDWKGYSYVSTTAPPQVPLKAGIRFEGIPDGSRIRLLRIFWGDRYRGRFPVDFRDPAVTRRE